MKWGVRTAEGMTVVGVFFNYYVEGLVWIYS